MQIRKATVYDIPRILTIYDDARAFMRRSGNMNQWTNGYPSEDILREDTAAGNLYVVSDGELITGVFFFSLMDDPTYHVIDGAWSSDMEYGVIHRIARTEGCHDLLHQALSFASAFTGYIRIDTHQDNIPMQRALEREGFRRCGRIWIADGSERIAFDRLCYTD